VSWPMVKISDFCVTGSGGTPLRSNSAFYDGDIPWIKSGELRENMITKASEFITELAVEKSSAKIVPAGSILLAMYGATVGRMAILGIDATTNQAICNIIPDKEIALPKYVYYALLNRVPYFLNNAVGGAQPNISQGIIKDTEIPLPPLTEQKRIAAILDKADSLRRKNQQAIQLADQFLRAAFLDMFGDPVTNPKKWEVKKLKEMSHIQIGPFGTQLHKEDYIEGGIPLINPTHIVNGKIVSNMNYTIPSNKHAELDEYHLKAGDIIMGRRGEMGRCAVVTEQENGWLCGTGSLFIRTYNAEIFAEYLCTLLSGKTIKSYLEAESQGATMSNLNKTIVGNINIPVPSENALKKYSIIQEKIMKNINKMDCFSGELLFNSLSQKAFGGKL
jgi:type I restriction enzyme S subunit